MKKISVLLPMLACFATISLAQTPEQTLRGTIIDADNGEPLAGASILLLKTTPPNGTSSTLSGSYVFEKLPIGRYQVQASHLGYETLTIAEVLVEAGRETVLNIQLRERPDSLQTVVVKAPSAYSASSTDLGKLTFSVEEQFRFPATNFDPARLATAYPGVTGENDGTNIISVRGNSPNAFQWRLEGVEIVNPNHTANAGTFGDRPSGAAGGVNILSAQLLGTSTLYTGAFPAQYGNSLGGIMDMYFRKGNNQRHEFIAQAGFIGIEAAAEGPIGVGPKGASSSTVGSGRSGVMDKQNPSFLVNYRYSFTGLLTGMGVDFGDEETAFQDVAFHVSLPAPLGPAPLGPSAKAGQFTVFGMGGKSYNRYLSPTDSATIDKERFNIDFESMMGALGMTHVLPIGKKNVLRTVAIGSALEHDRTADFVETGERWEDDHLRRQKLSFFSILSHKINARYRWRAGVEAVHNDDTYRSLFKNNFAYFNSGGNATGWLVQPFFEFHFHLSEKLKVVAGAHASIITTLRKEVLPEPRLSINYSLGRGNLVLAYGRLSQNLPVQVLTSSYATKYTSVPRAHHLTLGYQVALRNSMVFKAEVYEFGIFNVPVYEVGENAISTINFTDYSQTYLGPAQVNTPIRLTNAGEARSYGLDVSLQKYLTDRFFFLFAGSIYRSEYTEELESLGFIKRSPWRSTRFDGRHTLNLTAGREFAKQKNGKTILSGISSRVAWLGGFRETPIDLTASKAMGYTVFQQQFAFAEKLDDYFRIDLRLYRKWNKAGRNSMLSLDIQNITAKENAQYHYYDSVQDKVLLKHQLGLIPILTWRGEF